MAPPLLDARLADPTLLYLAGLRAKHRQAQAATSSRARWPGGEHSPDADALRARPGEWALLGKYSTPGVMRQEAYAVRNALDPKDQPFAPAGSFDAASHAMCGEYRVYVRFLGGDAA